jgi:hypothetical protein
VEEDVEPELGQRFAAADRSWRVGPDVGGCAGCRVGARFETGRAKRTTPSVAEIHAMVAEPE